jgi:hypothetical protein
MGRAETALGKGTALTAKLLSGWRVPTSKDAKVLAVLLLRWGK